MKQLINILLLLQVMIYVACNDSDRIAPTGYLYLGVDSNTSIQTRSERPVSDEILRVDIITASGDTLRTYDNYLTDVKGEKIMLPVGTYTVAVSSADKNGSAWDEPYYHGSAETTIKDGETNQITVVCKVANTGVRVLYDNDGSGDNDLNDYLVDYYTEVSVGDNELTYVKDETRTGYFTTEGDLVAVFHATNLDGNKFALKRTISNVAPTTLYTLKYQLKNEGSSGADIDIEVDKDSTQVHCTIFIKEEDFISSAQPKLEVTNMEEGNKVEWRPYVMDENNQPVEAPKPTPAPTVNLHIPAGIENMKVNVTSNRFKESSLGLDESLISSKNGQIVNLNETLLIDPTIWKDIQAEENHIFQITILDKLHQEVSLTFTLTIEPNLSVKTLDASAFTSFAFLQGESADKEGLRFKIWEDGTDSNTAKVIEATPIVEGERFGAIVVGLIPGKNYNYCALSGSNEGSIKSFVLGEEKMVDNMNFEAGWTTNKKSGKKPGGPWDSGNSKVLIATVDNTKEETSLLATEYSKKAVKMISNETFGNFAAGNIYTGVLQDINMDPAGAALDFGISYSETPTILNGYYFYQPQIVNKGSHAGMSGKKDLCSIYVLLCDWTTPFRVETYNGKFVNINDPSVLAYGELPIDKCTGEGMTGYEYFEIPIVYRDITRKPKYILIVASASKYGDYFTGGNGSTLYIDEFSLGFDYNAESFKGTEMEGLTPIDITNNNKQ